MHLDGVKGFGFDANGTLAHSAGGEVRANSSGVNASAGMAYRLALAGASRLPQSHVLRTLDNGCRLP